MEDTPRRRRRQPTRHHDQSGAAHRSYGVAASPLATGDHGGRYQDAVGGWMLSQLLMGMALPVATSEVANVGFQRGIHGARLDDIVVVLQNGSRIEFSVKVRVHIRRSDRSLNETLQDAWPLYKERDDVATGLICPPSDGVEALKELVFGARHHGSVADFMRAIDIPNAQVRQFYSIVRAILNDIAATAISDDDFYAFLRQFYVLALDLQRPSSNDLASVLGLLQARQSISGNEARILFTHLVTIAEDDAIASAGIDRASLVARLTRDQVHHGTSNDVRPALAALDAYAVRTFEASRSDVAGIRLDRASVVDSTASALSDAKVPVLIGGTGAGKSVLVRSIYERLASGGPVLHLSGRRVEHAGSWSNLALDIGIPAGHSAMIDLLRRHENGPTVILDAPENAETAGARTVLNDFLVAVAAHGRLNLIVSTRDYLLADLYDWFPVLRSLGTVVPVSISAPTGADVRRLIDASPALRRLAERFDVRRTPGNLMMLRLIADAGHSVDHGSPPTEVDLLDVWWERVLVGADASRSTRLGIVLHAAGQAAIAPSGLFTLPPVFDARVVEALGRDGVLVLDVSTDRFRFGHDLIRDYALVRWLFREPQDARARLSSLVRSPGNYHAITLYAQRLLERDAPAFDAVWSLDTTTEPRLRQAFASALAASSRANEALSERRSDLLSKEDAQPLADLLNVVSAEHVTPDLEAFQLALQVGADVPSARVHAASSAIPRAAIWGPLLRFCAENREMLGRASLPYLRMAERWQRLAPAGHPSRESVFWTSLWFLDHLERWRRQSVNGPAPAIPYDDCDSAAGHARAVVALSTDVDANAVVQYLTEVRERGGSGAKDDMLRHLPILASTLGDDAVEYGFAVLTHRREQHPGERDMSDFGLRAHFYSASSDVQGPFLPLLLANESAGLALIHRLAQRASDWYSADPHFVGNAHWRPLTFVLNGRTIELFGDERTYSWFRPSSQGSKVLTSALMAVETWAHGAVKSGRDALEVADLLLRDTTAVAFLGIVAGLAYEHRALIPSISSVVAQPWFWRLELSRYTKDMMPDFTAFLPAELQFDQLQPHIKERNAQREAERTRLRHPMVFAVSLLFTREDDLHDSFRGLLNHATVSDACLWVEEVSNTDATEARQAFDQFLSRTNPNDYERDGDAVRWVPPEVMRPTPADESLSALRQKMLVTDLDGANRLREYRIPSNLNLFDAAGRNALAAIADGNLNEDDVEAAYRTRDRCASVLVTFSPNNEVEVPDWARHAVLDAVGREDKNAWHPDTDDEQVTDLRVSIATALGALLAADTDDEDLRRLSFRAAGVAPRNVAVAVLRGLLPAWHGRPETPFNVFAVLTIVALRSERRRGGPTLTPGEIERLVTMDSQHQAFDVPAFTHISQTAAYWIAQALSALPRRFSFERAVTTIRPLIERFASVAIRRDSEDGDEPLLQLTSSLAGAATALSFADMSPAGDALWMVLRDWRRSLEFFANVAGAAVRNNLSVSDLDENVVERFRGLAQPFLSADHRAVLSQEHLRSPFRDACWHLVAIDEFDGLMLGEDWPHAGQLEAHLAQWVSAVGGHPTTASALLSFLSRFGSAFGPACLLRWITHCADATALDLRHVFWERNGRSMATLLLRLLESAPEVFREQVLHAQGAALADAMVVAGVQGAGEVRTSLEALANRG